MGLESGIWDDSALIRAFDDAMTKYKVMHGMCQSDSGSGEKVENSADREVNPVDVSRNIEFHHDSNNISNSPAENAAASDTSRRIIEVPALDASDPTLDSNIKTSCTYMTTDPASSGQFDGYATPQYAEYAQLFSKYNDLEMQRQQVLQQIHQASYSNYQLSSDGCLSSLPWDACCCTSEAHQSSVYHPAHPCLQSLCHPCFCVSAQHFTTSCSNDIGCATISGTHATVSDSRLGTINQSSADDNVVTLGMEIAERALASMKIKAFESSQPYEGEQGGPHYNSSDTQIFDLLTAWYSAGFYTGKYLSEQSIAKRS